MEHRSGTGHHKVQRMDPNGIRKTAQPFWYNEWILTELERQLSLLRVRNAQACALEDASKNLDGPMGQGRR